MWISFLSKSYHFMIPSDGESVEEKAKIPLHLPDAKSLASDELQDNR
jgi:hypothetical protein